MIRKANIRYSWKGFAIPLLLSALMLLTACTDYDALLPTKAEEPSQAERLANADTLFLNLSIVSNSNVTRAAEVGTSAENAIYDGILCIFEGNGETNAVLKSATVIDQLINNPNEPRPTILSSSSSIDIVQRLPIGTHPYPNDGKLYALVLLNTTSTGFTVSNNMLYLNGASLAGKTREQIQSMIINSVGSTDEHTGLFMTNKPKESGQVAIQMNAYDDKCYLFDSEEAIALSTLADNNKKLTINVERAAARVKVTNDIPAATVLDNIILNDNASAHPKIHKMTWAANNYYSKCYAIRGGSGGTLTTNTFRAADFTVYQQHSLQNNEAIYIAEGSADVIVEVQLKDGSFLLDDCYQFNGTANLYTSPIQLINHIKTNWWPTNKATYTALSSVNVDEVFKNTKIEINTANGNVTMTLTNADLDQTSLNTLAADLSLLTKGFCEGRMYYTYSLSTIERNNAYNMSLSTSSISGIGRPTP